MVSQDVTEETEVKENEIQSEQAVDTKVEQDKSQDINPETISAPDTVVVINEEKENEENNEEDTTQIAVDENELTCTLSVMCDEAVGKCKEKNAIIPSDGIIYLGKAVSFINGESVFDVLLREMTENKIHLEFKKTPIYNSMYIEGIGNLYEFDCGETSGWKYKVNGEFPNVGCSSYILKAGDSIEWVYVCGNDKKE